MALAAAACSVGATQHAAPAAPYVVPDCTADTAGGRNADTDGDGLTDACELALATAFAPTLVAAAGACNVLATADGPRIGGGYLFVVEPASTGARIGYLPAYYQDCGWSGIKCHLPGVDCAPHDGDSEFLVVDVRREEGGWLADGVFLSAHCFGRSTGNCRWYRGGELDAFEWAEDGAGPVVWVANGRNANYPSRNACENGHTLIDTCTGERIRYRFPVHGDRNIGSRTQPRARDGTPPGCVAAGDIDPTHAATDAGAVECFWDTRAQFRGWQAAADGVTPYEHYLRTIAGF